MEGTVFISYSSKNIKEVASVTDRLERARISYWKAPEMIPAGSNYAREIPKAIAASSVFLLLVSKESQQSIWVEKELDCAMNHGVTVVPLRIDREPLCDVFQFYLNNVQTIDCINDQGRAFNQMESRLKSLLDAKTTVQTEYVACDDRQREHDFAHRRQQRVNAFSPNEIPVVCEYCGGELKKVSEGEFRCKMCGEYSYDSFRKVRKYLEKNGARSILQIARATGVPKNNVEYFLRDGRLEVSRNSYSFLKCEKCGASIRSGRLCELCKIGSTR